MNKIYMNKRFKIVSIKIQQIRVGEAQRGIKTGPVRDYFTIISITLSTSRQYFTGIHR
jgi:hypothetical protein